MPALSEFPPFAEHSVLSGLEINENYTCSLKSECDFEKHPAWFMLDRLPRV